MRTTSHGTSHRGRRPASSRDTLEEAAEELFLENGYAATTIEQITRRAGVSRNTFFNYFSAKSDVLFAGVDDTAQTLVAELTASPEREPAIPAVRAALLRTASTIRVGTIPLAASQWEAMGVSAELQASGLVRVAAMAATIARFVTARLGERAAGLPVQAAAYAITAACVSALLAWVAAGVGRGALADYLTEALDPVCDGYARRFARDETGA